MSFYNTGNPVPSIDPRDLDDNAKHVDELVNSTLPTFTDRLGAERRTLAGIEADADAIVLRDELAAPGGSGLIGDLSIPITKHGAIADWNGTTGTNCKDAFLATWNEFISGNYRSMSVPLGSFYLELVDSDLTDVGFNRDFAFLMATGKKGLVLTGPGELHIRCSSSTKRVVFAVFKDCDNCKVINFNLTGDLVKQDGVPNSETGVAMGFMFYHCTGSGASHNTVKNILVPFWFTGQPKSPATTTDVSAACYLTDNTIENFEQNSTFGAGAYGLRVQNNTFINGYTAFKVSQNPSSDAAAGKAGLVNFTGNTVYWTPDAQFAAVFFSPTNAEAAVGLMIECANTDVFVGPNTISLEGVTTPSLPLIGNAGPIVIFESPNEGTAGALITRKVTIQGGAYTAKTGYSTRYAIDSTAKVYDLVITGVTHVGGIRVQSGAVPATVYGDIIIKGNTGHGIAGTTLALTVGLGRWKNAKIEQNSLTGIAGQETSGYETILFPSGFVCEKLIMNDNTLENGGISNFSSPAVTCTSLVSTGCTARGFDLATIGTLRAVLENDYATTGTACKLTLDAATMASCRVSVGGSCSSPSGGNSSTALNLNGGLLRLNPTEMFANSGSAFVFGAGVTLQGGEYYGNGIPTLPAIFGSRYVDFAAGANGAYLKTTSSGASGWFRSDTFISGTATVDIPSVAANGTYSFDVTVTGAAFGNTSLATGGNSTGVGLVWSAQVSAADTVKVTVYNPTASAIDPTSQTITVRVFK